jgi:hypothetical protein
VAAQDASARAPGPVPEHMSDLPHAASDAETETSRDRVYLLLSKQGNKVAFKRSAVISSIEIDLEGSWEFSPGLPVVQQCPEIGPFPIVVDRGAADKIGTEIELYSERQATRSSSQYSAQMHEGKGSNRKRQTLE